MSTMDAETMRGKQVSPPAPFRKVSLGSRLEVATQTAGVNPAYLLMWLMDPSPLRGGQGGGPYFDLGATEGA